MVVEGFELGIATAAQIVDLIKRTLLLDQPEREGLHDLEVDEVEVHGMPLEESVDEVKILDRSDLWVVAGSHIEHVVSVNHKLLVPGQAQERPHSLKHNALSVDER